MHTELHKNEDYIKMFEQVKIQLKVLINSPDAIYNDIKSSCGIMKIDAIDSKIDLLGRGLIDFTVFQAIICRGQPFKTAPVGYIWDSLIRSGIFQKVMTIPGGIELYYINKELIDKFLVSDTFPNIFCPPRELLCRYAGSIVAIDVLVDKKDKHRGTGFIITNKNKDRRFILTCRHNLKDQNKKIEIENITSANGNNIEFNTPVFSEKYDIAAIEIDGSVTKSPFFYMSDNDGFIFDEVYTIGFPFVPQAHPSIIGHRGEINGIVDLYTEKHPVILISNLTSPGSSGGPVLDRNGFCVGMSFEWLEAEYG